MTDYNDGKWHGWNGGECPVHPESVVEVVTRKYGCQREKGSYFGWDHNGHLNPIIAFRVVEPYREPREWWVDLLDMTVTKTPCHAASYYVKFQEVIDND